MLFNAHRWHYVILFSYADVTTLCSWVAWSNFCSNSMIVICVWIFQNPNMLTQLCGVLMFLKIEYDMWLADLALNDWLVRPMYASLVLSVNPYSHRTFNWNIKRWTCPHQPYIYSQVAVGKMKTAKSINNATNSLFSR